MTLKNLLLGTLTWVILLIFLSIPLTILIIWKVGVIIAAKILRPDLFLPNATDCMFSNVGNGWEKSTVNVGFVCQIDGVLNVAEVRELFVVKFFSNGVPAYDRLRSTIEIWGKFGFFKKLGEVDVNRKILEKTLPEGQILEDFVVSWMLEKYEENSSCWEIIVVGWVGFDKTVVGFKIHHAFADGYTLLYILEKLTGNSSSPYLVKDFEDSVGKRVRYLIHSLPKFGNKLLPAVIVRDQYSGCKYSSKSGF